MAPKPLMVLMIEDSPDYAELVQHWLSAPGGDPGFVLNWTDSLSSGLQRLASGGVDVVLLDLRLPDSSGAETFLSLRDRAAGVPVVILSAADDEAQALQLIQEGAENYLVKSSCDRHLLSRALRFAVVKHSQAVRAAREASGPRATLVGVMGSKGGAGATTVACNLAAELHRQTEGQVLLVDLDLNGGLAVFLSCLEPKHTLDSALANLDRLDRTFWDALVTLAPSGFYFAGATALAEGGGPASGEVCDLLSRVRSWYDWMVLDLGRLTAFSGGLLELADELIVVTGTALPELYQAKRTVEALGRLGIGPDRIHMAVNAAGGSQSFTQSELKSVFGADVYATFPEAGEEIHAACLKKRLPDESSAIRRETAKVARRIAGLPELKPKGILDSLSHRFRKPGEPIETVSFARNRGRLES